MTKKKSTSKPRTTAGGKAQHVVPMNNHWIVRSAGKTGPTATYKTQAEAIEAAREIAKGHHSEVVIHSRDGRIKHRVSISSADELMLRVWGNIYKGPSKSKEQ
jgi:uncharacterized membrane protein YkoI